MPKLHHDPIASFRNHKRVRFIKGLYSAWREINLLYDRYQDTGIIEYDQIDSLLETYLRGLKDLAHELYNTPESIRIEHKRQRIFDRLLGEIWYELDKARDNVRLIENFQLDRNAFYANGDQMLESLASLDEQVVYAAKQELPLILHRVRSIVDQVIPLFEQILPLYKGNIVVLRTIYFDQNALTAILQLPAVEYFFPLIQGSMAEGYAALIRSLIRTKHLDQARAALERMAESDKDLHHQEQIEALRNELQENAAVRQVDSEQ